MWDEERGRVRKREGGWEWKMMKQQQRRWDDKIVKIGLIGRSQ